MLIVSLPVRLASYWFKSERQGWGISFAVIILGAMLVSAISFYAPGLWAASHVVRLGVAFFIFLVLSSVMLGMKPWQAAILALFIACVYSFGTSPVPRFIVESAGSKLLFGPGSYGYAGDAA